MAKVVRIYHYNGELSHEYYQVYDKQSNSFKIEGEFKQYYENGDLEYSAYCNNTIRNGTVKGYFENGNISGICNFKDGKSYGKYLEYHPDGKLIKTKIYDNGNIIDVLY